MYINLYVCSRLYQKEKRNGILKIIRQSISMMCLYQYLFNAVNVVKR